MFARNMTGQELISLYSKISYKYMRRKKYIPLVKKSAKNRNFINKKKVNKKKNTNLH